MVTTAANLHLVVNSETIPSTAPSHDPISLSGTNTAAKDPLLPCFSVLWEKNGNFHGRRPILERLRNALAPAEDTSGSLTGTERSGPRCVTLSGPGGIGKTQVAVQFVYEHEPSFDAVLWVYADDATKLARSYARIATDLGLVDSGSTDAQDEVLTRGYLLNWLNQPYRSLGNRENERATEASWLIVFDNADNIDLLHDYWPHGSGSILVTSRDPLLDMQFHHSSSFREVLPVFDEDESVDLLLKLTRRGEDEDDPGAVHAAANVLGGIPLAVAQMAGSIVRRDITFTEFVQEYNDPRSHPKLFSQPAGHAQAPNYEHTIFSVWALDELKHSTCLLDILAFLDPDYIPEYILLGVNGTGSEASKDIHGFPGSIPEYIEARAELLQASLVSRDRSAKKLFMHRLIQDTVISRMSEERYSSVYVSALQLISCVWDYEEDFGFIKEEAARWRRCEELYSHVLHLRNLSSRLAAPTIISEANLQPPKVVLAAAWLGIGRGDYVEAGKLIQLTEKLCKALQVDESVFAEESSTKQEFDELVLQLPFHRGALAHHTNEPRVALDELKTYIRLLDKKPKRRQTAAWRQQMAIGLNDLGVSYLQNDDAVKAEDYLEQSIAILGELSDISPNTISMPQINLGFAFSLQGRHEEAADMFERTLVKREQNYGRDDVRSFALGKLLLGYGNVKAAQHKFDESLELHERCLKQYKGSVGAHHHRTGDACVHVANHYLRLHKFDDALVLLDQAGRIFRGRSHFRPEDARVCYKRWKTLLALGRLDEARFCGNTALRLYQAMTSDDDRQLEALSEDDFDKRIMFWSR
ncbi:uncharacterized protein LTR77_004225 [Saxophila tyrrhenica]|uniref:DUF7779 domain-containing protein n=1 Tax=Saxophila tyrrhenica TaxID=1690608 RepID=A0AAV9PD13_9PEZI|nr:hypothetical protein LTR77_004225 [Saxophila tyrrhenica]